MKLRGSVSKTPLPGYPKLQNNDGKIELQVNYHLNNEEISSLPEDGEDFLDERFPQFHGLGLRLTRLNLTPKNGYSIWLLEDSLLQYVLQRAVRICGFRSFRRTGRMCFT